MCCIIDHILYVAISLRIGFAIDRDSREEKKCDLCYRGLRSVSRLYYQNRLAVSTILSNTARRQC